ncbi:MAG: GH92 family glycosyl hydrolase [Marinilabiliaceae bacterium]
MKSVNKRLFVGVSILTILTTSYAQSLDYVDEVDPNIGSAHSRWFFYTPAAMPFGMAKPAPSTNGQSGNKWGWEAVGYDHRHESIEGFVNFHEFQIGGVALMPTEGELKTVRGSMDDPDSGYRSRFSHENEVARPGYYQVFLDDYDIKAELTSTRRVAFHRYTFPESDRARILFDIGHRQGESGEVSDAFVRMTSDRTIEGFVSTLPEYVKNYQKGAQVKMYFVAELDKAPEQVGSFIDEKISAGQLSAQGKGCGLYLTFETREDEAVNVKVGVSYTSIENARNNLKVEAAGVDFKGAEESARHTWNQMLGRIAVEGGKDEDRKKFYTGLYHALLGRGLASDVNGAYVKNDGSIGQIPLNEDGSPVYHHYNTDAVWGAFWNLTQLWGLVYPDYLNQFVNCQLDIFDETGWLADGIATSKYVSGVGTNFMGQVIVSAYNRGIRGFDVEQAYQAVRRNELGGPMHKPAGVGKFDTPAFVEHGYVPFVETDAYYSGTLSTGSKFSASHTLEYSFSAYAAAQMARSLGKESDYTQLMELSTGWEKLFDDETGFIRPKDQKGNFLEDFDPQEGWRGFQEGNAYQYTFYVPHDPESLIERMGRDKFNSRLDNLFAKAEETAFGGGEEIDAFAGVQNVYNHGNQPSLHISWLFNFSGAPWLTQKWVRRICNGFYGTGGIHGYGYGQDEDQGQLGAWYVMAGMGLFDVKGGSEPEPSVQLGTPLFDKVTLRLDRDYYKGETFEIVVKGDPSTSPYIQNTRLNGKDINRYEILWEELTNGGKLEMVVGSEPNKNWGSESIQK